MSCLRMHSFFGAAVYVLILVTVSGCSSFNNKHALYEGDVVDAATIRSYETVQIDYIDNRDMGYSLVGQVKEFGILPGSHTLIVKYKDFWEPATGDEEKVVSVPVKVTFEAQPSQTYQILHKPLVSLKAAEKFSSNPIFFVRNVATDRIVEAVYEVAGPSSFLSNLTFDRGGEQFAKAPSPTTQQRSQFTNDTDPVKPTRLNALQQIWLEASKQEKADFLSWITVK